MPEHRDSNQVTQPHREQPVFDNWDVVAEGWYLALPARELPRGKARSVSLFGQRVVLFRGRDGEVRALDAWCPHMGADLGVGDVVGNHVRCPYHHWEFDGAGRCHELPVDAPVPEGAALRAYATQERYGFLWVYPAEAAPYPVPEPRGLEGEDIACYAGASFVRGCHTHVQMANGIDAQHLRTIHKVRLAAEVEIDEDPDRALIDYHLRGALPDDTPRARAMRWVLGESYGYRMRLSGGTMGFLTGLVGVTLFGGKLALPEIHMGYGFTSEERGSIRMHPFFLTRRRPGLLGWWVERLCLVAMHLVHRMLRDEDGLIYDNIRFRPAAMLAMDAPVVRFMQFVNRQVPSCWSRRVAV